MGAEVHNADLTRLDDEVFAEIERALYQHGMLVFLGQNLTHRDQSAFTLRFGEHGVDAFTDGVPDYPDIQPVIREPGPPAAAFFGAHWHTDSPFLPRPPAISMLRSVEVPPWGGDTVYASTRQAYESLSTGMKHLLADLRTLFTRTHVRRAVGLWEDNPELPLDLVPIEHDQLDATAHPLVRTHPVTGEKSLYLDFNYTVGIAGLHRKEAASLLQFLLAQVTQPEFSCRIRWEPNMLAIWDNRLVLHQAFNDVSTHRREMYRSTVLGEVPV